VFSCSQFQHTSYLNRRYEKRLAGIVFAAIGLLAAQVILGGLTVLGLLDPKWVSSHLAVALGFFGVVVVTTLKLYDAKNGLIRPIQTSRLSAAAVITSMILFGQILLGGLVSSNYAGLACADFPKCNGQWLPVLEGLVGYQVLHRIGAVAATIALTGFSILAWTRMPSKGRAGLALRTIPALLLLQLLLGVGKRFFSTAFADECRAFGYGHMYVGDDVGGDL
jgi:cytochrome c oxidase assembly protein subunit 15